MMKIFLSNRSVEVSGKGFPGQGRGICLPRFKEYTLALYKKCAEYALSKGIIIADTKFEFGLDEDGNVVLADEMLTPDSFPFLAMWRAMKQDRDSLLLTSSL